MTQIARTHFPLRMALAGLATTLLMLVAATHAAASQDLRSPDARDSAVQAPSLDVRDLRSPDARDSAARSQATVGQSLASPDARDGGRGLGQTPTPSGGSSHVFEWGYLAIGVGLTSVPLAGAVATTYRRRRRVRRSAVALGS
jgi:hypothetical protein